MTSSGSVLRVKKLTELAILPVRGSALAAGFDLSSAYDAVVPARGKALVKTDLAIATPEGTYARVAPRSGLAWKKFIDTGAGVIDADYRGNVGVILFNHADEDFEVKRGDRVAQLILERIEYPEITVVDEIEETERGAGGFGSTGVDAPLKRPRPADASPKNPTADDAGAINGTVIYDTLAQLFADGVIDDAKRLAIKKRLFTASETQLELLRRALSDFGEHKKQQTVLEWLDAFVSTSN